MSMEGELLKNFRKKVATKKYPFVKEKPPEGLRGRLVIDMVKCIGCGLCSLDCPAAAIEMIGKGPMAEFKIHLDRCHFCGQCAESCPSKCITYTNDFELASGDKNSLTIEFKRKPKEKTTP